MTLRYMSTLGEMTMTMTVFLRIIVSSKLWEQITVIVFFLAQIVLVYFTIVSSNRP